jgi:hypothetical protein
MLLSFKKESRAFQQSSFIYLLLPPKDEAETECCFVALFYVAKCTSNARAERDDKRRMKLASGSGSALNHTIV